MQKQSIRQEYVLKRRQMSAEEASLKSEQICQRLTVTVDWPLMRSMHIYRSQSALREVETKMIIGFVQNKWPHIELTIGTPSRSAPLPRGKYDIIIVPLVAFDAQRNRLGFGGGWYDKFLALQPQATTIGLAYEFQRTNPLPVEKHDICLSKIITETKIY